MLLRNLSSKFNSYAFWGNSLLVIVIFHIGQSDFSHSTLVVDGPDFDACDWFKFGSGKNIVQETGSNILFFLDDHKILIHLIQLSHFGIIFSHFLVEWVFR